MFLHFFCLRSLKIFTRVICLIWFFHFFSQFLYLVIVMHLFVEHFQSIFQFAHKNYAKSSCQNYGGFFCINSSLSFSCHTSDRNVFLKVAHLSFGRFVFVPHAICQQHCQNCQQDQPPSFLFLCSSVDFPNSPVV